MPMIGRILRFSPIALVLVAAACGGGQTKTVTVPQTSSTSTTPGAAMSLRVYFLRNGKVQPVLRTVPQTKAVAGAALDALLQGPTAQEKQLGLTTQVSSESSLDVERSGGVLTVHGDVPDGAPLAQVVYTTTQFPTSTTVEVNGKQYTRGSLEDFTPAILVELPLPFQHVSSPVRIAGSANTFEATFQYELKDASGKVLAKHFVTATSGNGVRGTFDVTVPFRLTQAGTGTLSVYENSAANGKRINQVDIPVQLER
jgi:Immunoglobulin-like domain of bacterial spore germination/Sporulation and spore germination